MRKHAAQFTGPMSACHAGADFAMKPPPHSGVPSARMAWTLWNSDLQTPRDGIKTSWCALISILAPRSADVVDGEFAFAGLHLRLLQRLKQHAHPAGLPHDLRQLRQMLGGVRQAE